MTTLSVEIKKIKGVESAFFEIPLESGIYALVGSNGSGKSTILQVIAQLVRPANALQALKPNDYCNESEANFDSPPNVDKWYTKELHDRTRWINSVYQSSRKPGQFNNINLQGMYEGSLFVGTRFQDSRQVDELISKGKLTSDALVE